MTRIIREQLDFAAIELVDQIRSTMPLLGQPEALGPRDAVRLRNKAAQLQQATQFVQSHINRWDDYISQLPPDEQADEEEQLTSYPMPPNSDDILGEGETFLTMTGLVAKAERIQNLLLAAVQEAELESESQTSQASNPQIDQPEINQISVHTDHHGDDHLLMDAQHPPSPVPAFNQLGAHSSARMGVSFALDPLVHGGTSQNAGIVPMFASTPNPPINPNPMPIMSTSFVSNPIGGANPMNANASMAQINSPLHIGAFAGGPATTTTTTTTTTVATMISQNRPNQFQDRRPFPPMPNSRPSNSNIGRNVQQIGIQRPPTPPLNPRTAFQQNRPPQSAPTFQQARPFQTNRANRANARMQMATAPVAQPESIFRHTRIEPPKFKGDPKEWPTFWITFEESVHSMAIPDYQKHILLLQYLERDSPARKAIEAYQPSNENYPVVLQILQTKFGNVSVLREQLRAELYHRPMATNSTASLRALSEDIERICLQLSQLSPTGEGDFVRTIIRSKLPQAVLLDLTQREWDSEHEWSEAELRKGLARVVAMRESVEVAVKTLRPEEEKKHSEQRNQRPRGGPQHTRAFVGTEAAQPETQPSPQSVPNHQNSRKGPRKWDPDRACSLCEGKGHQPSNCPQFPTPQKRREQIGKQRRCFKCLASGHSAKECKDQRECRHCKAKTHHSLLCNAAPATGGNAQALNSNAQKPTNSDGKPPNPQITRTTISIDSMAPEGGDQIKANPNDGPMFTLSGTSPKGRPQAHLMTRLVTVSAPNNPKIQTQALLIFDSASQTSYVASSLVDQLRPKQIGIDTIHVEVFGGAQMSRRTPVRQIRIQCMDGHWENVALNEVDCIGSVMRTTQWAELEIIPDQAVPDMDLQSIQGIPEILIGTRQFWDYFVSRSPKSEAGYYVIQTIFGAVIGGESSLPESTQAPSFSMIAVHPSNVEQMPPSNQIEEFWSLETIGIREDPAQDDDQVAEKQFESSVRQLDDGRYCVRWPWREAHPELPSNFRTAYRRLAGTLNKFQHNSELLNRYQNVLQDQLAKGIIEEAEIRPGTKEHYLPHHAVVTPEKIRIVHEANSHTKGSPCLNDCLYRGPVLLPALDGMLLRFRCCRCPVCADVEKAFLMIELEVEDREVCKFLWVRDPTKPLTTDNLVAYRFKRVAFGVVSSPFMLSGVIRHHLRKYTSYLAGLLLSNTFVDNVLMESETDEEGIDQSKEAKQIFSDAKMNLREFVSCSQKVMDQIPEEDKLNKQIAKVLGVKWDTQLDQLLFTFPDFPSNRPITRRTVLSTYSTFFDPHGLFGPCLLDAKLYFQKLWDLSHGWDDPIDQERIQTWLNIIDKWHEKSARLPRYALLPNWTKLELHVFTDASENAYAAAVFLRSETDEQIGAKLVFSKCLLKARKHAKTLTIPRLELLGILIGGRAQANVAKELRRPLSSVHLWSDSRIALGWVQSGKPVAQFIDRRVREIRSNTELEFHFVRSEDNPADIATRGAVPDGFESNALWWNGPSWLCLDSNQWPQELQFKVTPLDSDPPMDEEDVPVLTFAARTARNLPPERSIDPAKYSSYTRLLRITAWAICFTNCARYMTTKKRLSSYPFNASELKNAEKALIRQEQQQLTLPIPGVEADGDGIFRSYPRMDRSNEPHNFKRPIELPKGSPLAEHFLRRIHLLKLKHGGVDWTRATFLADYSMPGIRGMINKIIARCTRCARINTHKYALPRMPPLPEDRVQRRRPFESIGLDYLGPTTAKLAGQTVKVWIVIITCLTVRAVYLEPTTDLSARSFIQVLRRFISRRGCPKRMLSDNAKTFVSTQKVLNKLTEPYVTANPLEFAANNGIEWTFIPQHSPWSGGIYERLVSLVKKCIQRTLGRWTLAYDDLSAFLAEVEAAINMRPLTYFANDPNSLIPLRPVDFIQPEAHLHLAMNGRTFDPDDPNLTAHEKLAAFWLGTQEAVEHFWRRWKKEYLLMLRQKAGWVHKHPRLQTLAPPKVGDVVLIEEPLQPRNIWPMGRIEALNGQMPNIRSVKITMPNGRTWVRPINKIYPLEAAPEPTLDDMAPEPVEEVEIQPTATPVPMDIPVDAEEAVEQQFELNPLQFEPPKLYGMEKEESESDESQSEMNEEENAQMIMPSASDPEWNPALHERKRKTPQAHPMVTRRKGKLQMAPLLIPIICLWAIWTPGVVSCTPRPVLPAGPVPIPLCPDCTIYCSDRGVTVSTPPNINKLDLCCMNTCWSTVIQFLNQSFELSREFLLNDYKCTGTFWQDSNKAFWAEANCPAKDDCAILDCWFCLEQIANPTCNPKWAAFLLAVYFLAFLSLLGFLWNTFLRIKTGLWLVYSFLAFLCCLPVWTYNWATGRNIRTPSAALVKERIQRGARKVRRGIGRVRQEFRGGRMDEFRREFRASLRFPLLAFLLLATFAFVQPSSETISIVTKSESCRRGQTGVHCTINSATTLTLLPFGQTNTLLMRDEHGVVLGVLSISLKTLSMNCMVKSEAWLRPYRIETLAVKRCPRAGSCRGNHCGEVKSDSMVPELEKANEYPGNTFCTDSTSFWHNQCGLPASSCLYYRWHAKPMGRDPYEMVSCPSWDFTIGASLNLETNGGKSLQKHFILHPGITEHWGNISITPLAVSLPPAPILASRFITDGHHVAIVDKIPEDLHCANEESAREFNCSLSIDACRSCSLDHDLGSATCHCRDLDLQGLMENPAARFPLNIARLHLRNEGPAIIAETGYSPIQLHVQMKDLQLVLEFRDAKCWISNANLTGCYKCLTGAQMSFDCKTDWGTALALIECEDGTMFSSHCSNNGTGQRTILAYSHSRIETKCRVSCPAGDTEFDLNGQLYYVPLRRQFGYRSRRSATLDQDLPDSQPWFDFGFDPWNLLRLFANPQIIFIFFLALVVGLIALYLVIKFSPMFRVYKMLAGGMIGTHLAGRAHSIPISQPPSPFISNQLAKWQPSPQWADMLMWISLIITFGSLIVFLALIISRLCRSRLNLHAQRLSNRKGTRIGHRDSPSPSFGHGHGRTVGHGHRGINPAPFMASRTHSSPSIPSDPFRSSSSSPNSLLPFIQFFPSSSKSKQSKMPRGQSNSSNTSFGNSGFGPVNNQCNGGFGQPNRRPRPQNLPIPGSRPANSRHCNLCHQQANGPHIPPPNANGQNQRNLANNPPRQNVRNPLPRQNVRNPLPRQNVRNPLPRQNLGNQPNRQNPRAPTANIQGHNVRNPPAYSPGPNHRNPIANRPGPNPRNSPPINPPNPPPHPNEPIEDQIRLDHWVTREFGPEWHQDAETRCRVLQSIQQLVSIGWRLVRIHAMDEQMNVTGGWTRLPVRQELVMPNLTVERFWRNRGRTIDNPNWPAIRIEGGRRGTSRHSRRMQQRNGRDCWRIDWTHLDLIPCEGVLLMRHGPISTPLFGPNSPVPVNPEPPPYQGPSPQSTSISPIIISSSSGSTSRSTPTHPPSSSPAFSPICWRLRPAPFRLPQPYPYAIPLPPPSLPAAPQQVEECALNLATASPPSTPSTPRAMDGRPLSPFVVYTSAEGRRRLGMDMASNDAPANSLRVGSSTAIDIRRPALPSPSTLQTLALLLFIVVWGSRASALSSPLDAHSTFFPASHHPILPLPNSTAFRPNLPLQNSINFSLAKFENLLSIIPSNSCDPESMAPGKSSKRWGKGCKKCGGAHKANWSACPFFVSQAARPRTKFPPHSIPLSIPALNKLTQEDLDRELALAPPAPPDARELDECLTLGQDGSMDKIVANALDPDLPMAEMPFSSNAPLNASLDDRLLEFEKDKPGKCSPVHAHLPDPDQIPATNWDEKRKQTFAARLEYFRLADFPENPAFKHLKECEQKEREEEMAAKKLKRTNPNLYFVEEARSQLILAQSTVKSLRMACKIDPTNGNLRQRREEAERKSEIALGALIAAESRFAKDRKIADSGIRMVKSQVDMHSKSLSQNPPIPLMGNSISSDRRSRSRSSRRSRSESMSHSHSRSKRSRSTKHDRKERYRRDEAPFGHHSPKQNSPNAQVGPVVPPTQASIPTIPDDLLSKLHEAQLAANKLYWAIEKLEKAMGPKLPPPPGPSVAKESDEKE